MGWLWVSFLSLVTLTPGLVAQTPQKTVPSLLSPEQGRVVLSVARDHRGSVRRRPDCSHLVHEIYRRAGYSYPYATSFSLYDGISNFVQVKNPQPGDLIVWRGHVGIVVDPGKRTFYSSLTSGLRIDSYASQYWQGRGPIRYYRFVPDVSLPILVAATPPEQQKKNAWQSSESAITSGPLGALPSLTIPSSIYIAAASSRPTRQEVTEALSKLVDEGVDLLRANDLTALRHKMIIFDRFHVKSLNLKEKRGKVRIQIDSLMTINGKKIKLKRHKKKQQWKLRRDSSGWYALRPRNRAYVQREVAVHVLAEKLELLTRVDHPVRDWTRHTEQQARLAHILHSLLRRR